MEEDDDLLSEIIRLNARRKKLAIQPESDKKTRKEEVLDRQLHRLKVDAQEQLRLAKVERKKLRQNPDIPLAEKRAKLASLNVEIDRLRDAELGGLYSQIKQIKTERKLLTKSALVSDEEKKTVRGQVAQLNAQLAELKDIASANAQEIAKRKLDMAQSKLKILETTEREVEADYAIFQKSDASDEEKANVSLKMEESRDYLHASKNKINQKIANARHLLADPLIAPSQPPEAVPENMPEVFSYTPVATFEERLKNLNNPSTKPKLRTPPAAEPGPGPMKPRTGAKTLSEKELETRFTSLQTPTAPKKTPYELDNEKFDEMIAEGNRHREDFNEIYAEYEALKASNPEDLDGLKRLEDEGMVAQKKAKEIDEAAAKLQKTAYIEEAKRRGIEPDRDKPRPIWMHHFPTAQQLRREVDNARKSELSNDVPPPLPPGNAMDTQPYRSPLQETPQGGPQSYSAEHYPILHRYHVGEHPLLREKTLKTLEPTSLFKERLRAAYITTNKGELDEQTLVKHATKEKLKKLDEIADVYYARNFLQWLQGRSVHNHKTLTPWGTHNLFHIPGVLEYLKEATAMRHDFLHKLNKLAMFPPTSLLEAELYFKYIVLHYGLAARAHGQPPEYMKIENMLEFLDDFGLVKLNNTSDGYDKPYVPELPGDQFRPPAAGHVQIKPDDNDLTLNYFDPDAMVVEPPVTQPEPIQQEPPVAQPEQNLSGPSHRPGIAPVAVYHQHGLSKAVKEVMNAPALAFTGRTPEEVQQDADNADKRLDGWYEKYAADPNGLQNFMTKMLEILQDNKLPPVERVTLADAIDTFVNKKQNAYNAL